MPLNEKFGIVCPVEHLLLQFLAVIMYSARPATATLNLTRCRIIRGPSVNGPQFDLQPAETFTFAHSAVINSKKEMTFYFILSAITLYR